MQISLGWAHQGLGENFPHTVKFSQKSIWAIRDYKIFNYPKDFKIRNLCEWKIINLKDPVLKLFVITSKRTIFSPIALVNANEYVDRNSNPKMHRMLEIRFSFRYLMRLVIYPFFKPKSPQRLIYSRHQIIQFISFSYKYTPDI